MQDRKLPRSHWSDGRYLGVDPLAHLLALALMSTAGEDGQFHWSPATLKKTFGVFADADVQALLGQLTGAGIIRRVPGKSGVGQIIGMSKYLPETAPAGENVDSGDLLDAVEKPVHVAMAEIWNEKLGHVAPKVLSPWKMPSARRRNLALRFSDTFQTMDAWSDFLDKILESPFLTGQTRHQFIAGIDWTLKPSNTTKIMEGHYSPRGAATGERAAHNERLLQALR